MRPGKSLSFLKVSRKRQDIMAVLVYSTLLIYATEDCYVDLGKGFLTTLFLLSSGSQKWNPD